MLGPVSAHIHFLKFGLPTKLCDFGVKWASRGENDQVLSTLSALSNIDSVDSVDSDRSRQIETLAYYSVVLWALVYGHAPAMSPLFPEIAKFRRGRPKFKMTLCADRS